MAPKVFRMVVSFGLGDALLATPVFPALKKKFPGAKIHIFCEQQNFEQLFYHNPYVDSVKTITRFWKFYLSLVKHHTTSYGEFGPSFYNKHASEIVADKFGV